MKGRIEARLAQWLQRSVSIRFDRVAPGPSPPARTALSFARDEAVKDDPMIKQVVELFEARPVRVEVDDGSEG